MRNFYENRERANIAKAIIIAALFLYTAYIVSIIPGVLQNGMTPVSSLAIGVWGVILVAGTIGKLWQWVRKAE